MNATRRALLPTLLVALALVAGPASAHQRSWPGKRLAETFPEAQKFTLKQVVLTPDQVSWIEKNLGEAVRTEDRSPTFYVATGKEGRSAGVVLFLDAAGTNGKIELGLSVDPEGKVLRVVLFENAESSAVTSESFLSQFKGKKAADKLEVGEDVDAPSGNERGAQILATAVRRGLLLTMAGLRLGTK